MWCKKQRERVIFLAYGRKLVARLGYGLRQIQWSYENLWARASRTAGNASVVTPFPHAAASLVYGHI